VADKGNNSAAALCAVGK